MKLFKALSLFAGVMFASAAFAQDSGKTTLVIGSGGMTGTYHQMVDEMKQFCQSPTLGLDHYQVKDETGTFVPEGGSVKNLNNLLGNKEMVGIVQLDVAALQKLQKNPGMDRIVALMPLHEEQVHIIVPARVNTMTVEAEEGNFLGIGKKDAQYQVLPNTLNSVSDLNGRLVAAWGGSTVTAQVIQLQAGISFTIVPVPSDKEAFAMLDAGDVQAVLAVVGAPASWVAGKPKGGYKLLSVPKGIQDALSSIYTVSAINYDNMGDIGQQVEALTVPSILMTRVYKSPKMLNALSELQKCIIEKITDIQDTPNTHPAWQNVDPAAEMQWSNVFKPVSSTAVVQP